MNIIFNDTFLSNSILPFTADELKKMLYIFVCNDDELLVRLYRGDRLMKKVCKETSRLKDYIDELLYYDGEVRKA